jgi:hypothetical protein
LVRLLGCSCCGGLSDDRQEPDHDLRPEGRRHTYVVEFMTADGDVLSISIPRSEVHVIRHFQERMPYGLYVPDEYPEGT